MRALILPTLTTFKAHRPTRDGRYKDFGLHSTGPGTGELVHKSAAGTFARAGRSPSARNWRGPEARAEIQLNNFF